MGSREERFKEDPLGFTKQTATMLEGLGAKHLIPQFKRRNISTHDLPALCKEDLMVLGADETLANDMLKQLQAAAHKYKGRDLSEELRTSQLIKILAGSNQQLHLIETFIAYSRLKMTKNPEDFIIDPNKNIRASQALCVATACIMKELDELETSFQELAKEFPDYQITTKKRKSRLPVFFTGLGLIASLAITTRYALHYIKQT